MATHSATSEDISAYDLADIDLGVDAVYAKAGEWIAKLSLNEDHPTAAAAIARIGMGATLKRMLGQRDLALIELPRTVTYDQIRRRFDRLRIGQYIEPNAVIIPTGQLFPNDDYFAVQWGLHNTGQNSGVPDADIDAPEAWDITTGGSNVVMAVFDDGVDYTHPDLAANMWTNPGEIPGNGLDDDGNGYPDDYYGYDFGSDDGDPIPNNADHGTHIAGIMGAVGNNDTGTNNSGIAGVKWNAKIMAIKYSGNVVPFGAAIVAGLNYIVMMKSRSVNPVNVRVTNHSWFWPTASPPQSLLGAITLHQQHDILLVAAAGNGAPGGSIDLQPKFPASYDLDNIIAVANTTRTDDVFSGSNYGAVSVDLAAPGTDILSTVPIALDINDGLQDGYTLGTGTSQAAPHVAGVAGLAFSLPGMSNAPYQLIKGAILSGVDPIGHIGTNNQKPTVTNGRLNAYNTLNILLQSPIVRSGTTGNDTIIGRIDPTDSTKLEVRVNGVQVFLGPKHLVPSLTLNGLGGNDTITLEDSFFFPTTLDGGSGDDTISVLGDGVGAETVVISGDGAADVLNVDTDDVGLSRVRLNSSETLSALNIGAGGGLLMSAEGNRVLRTQSLSVTLDAGNLPLGFIDLADNEMIVDYTSTSPLASIQSLITSGYNAGAWTGKGIRSVAAAGRVDTGLGYAEASDIFTTFPATFAGQTVDNTTVLVRYTYYGDANLSGLVNLADFNRLAAHFGEMNKVWSQADFTYDGTVNLSDFNRLAANFGKPAIGPSDDVEDKVDWDELLEILFP